MKSSRIILKDHYPFSIKVIPFYYGWVILFVGAMGVIFSIPGQTMGVSVYTDHLISNLQLTRVQISTAYMIGTLLSAVIMTKAGIFFDKYGARLTAITATILLGVFVIFLSKSLILTNLLYKAFKLNNIVIPFILVTIGFFGIRFFGQGVLTLVSRGMVMKWFDRHRGLASAIMGIFTTFGFSYAPRVLQDLINLSGWSKSWFNIGIFLIICVTPIIFLFFRNSPEDCGIIIEDGIKLDKKKKNTNKKNEKNFTLAEAKKDPQLWFYLSILFYWAMYNTAFTFHITSIFSSIGKNPLEAVSIFLPISIIAVASRFLGSWLSDIVKMKYIFYSLILTTFLAAIAISLPSNNISNLLLIFGMGVASGLFGVMTSITWPKLYGRKHLGAISGLAMSFMVAGSAIGPWFFSLIESITGNYRYTGVISFCIVLLIGISSLPILLKSEI